MGNRRGPARAEHHVRLYAHELRCEAYRSLNPAARALLVEFRALFTGGENRIYMSVREAMRRLGVGQWQAERAISQLLDRGFIERIEKGSFDRKCRAASVYALTSEPVSQQLGAVAPKPFMRWGQKSPVLVTNQNGTSDQYRDHREPPKNTPDGTSDQYRKAETGTPDGTSHPYTDSTTSAAPITQPRARGQVACPCGGMALKQSRRRKEARARLYWRQCGACGRAGDFDLFIAGECVAQDAEAQRQWLTLATPREATA